MDILVNLEINVMTLDVGNLIDLNRRINFANYLSIVINIDILCLTKTWLTDDIPDEVMFLKNYTIRRNDRVSNNYKTKHDGVLIAVKNITHAKLKLENEFGAIKIEQEALSLYSVVCTIHQRQASTYGKTKTC